MRKLVSSELGVHRKPGLRLWVTRWALAVVGRQDLAWPKGLDRDAEGGNESKRFTFVGGTSAEGALGSTERNAAQGHEGFRGVEYLSGSRDRRCTWKQLLRI